MSPSASASFFRPDRTALITGGASGIGLALARRCQALGMRVLAADCDDELLALLDRSNGGGNKDAAPAITTFKMDVSKPADWAEVAKKVELAFGGRLNLLALNAGVGRPVSTFADTASFQHILDVNLYGVIHGIGALLPVVKATAAAEAGAAGAAARIVITGSKQGITNPPGNPAYNASKAAVRSIAEQLGFELRGAAGAPAVHLLVPGWTFTGMTGNRPVAGGGEPPKKPEGAWRPELAVEFLQRKMDDPAAFYIVCPDGETSEETDRKRVLWSAGDVVEGRPPLSRWRDEWEAKAREWMDSQKV